MYPRHALLPQTTIGTNVATAFACLLMLALPSQASANLIDSPATGAVPPMTITEEVDQFGLDYTPASERDEHSPEADEHIAEALLSFSTVPGLTSADRAAIESELDELAERNPTAAAVAREEIATRSMARLVVPPAMRTLSVAHQPQTKSYYCGPATASMIAKFKGKNYSQATLASSSYLKTDANGATKWALNVMAPTLNKTVRTTEYQKIQSPTLASLKASFVHDIGQFYLPVAVDTYEFKGGAHYNGHPVDKAIGHWIVGSGYASSGSTLTFLDPATNVWPGAPVKASFSHSASDFHRFVTTNGIIA